MMSQQKRTSTDCHQSDGSQPTQGTDLAELKISLQGQQALIQLLQSYEYADELSRNVWDFAVEIAVLRKLGLTNSDLRWLMCKGFVAQGRELSPEGQESRAFRRSDKLTFSRRTCFVAMEAGVEFIRRTVRQPSQLGGESVSPGTQDSPRTLRAYVDTYSGSVEFDETRDKLDSLLPVWDRDRQELRFGSQIVKQFKVPAPNQELVLSVFQEEGWPVRIDDPLPPHVNLVSKRRLHDTINSLNRQKVQLIRFAGDGKGTGVRWELLQPNKSARPSSRYGA